MKIGIIANWLRLPMRASIVRAAELGADGVQLHAARAVDGPTLMEYSDAELADLKKLCDDHHLVVSAICSDIGGHDFQIDGKNMERAEFTCRTIDLARKLGSRVITSHIGVVPDDPADPVYDNMVQAVRHVADYGAAQGVTMAIETGPERAETLLAFIGRVNSPGLGVNLDPANLKMVLNYDPVRAVAILGKYIVHTHAKDGVNLKIGSGAKVYGMANPDGTPREIAEAAAEFKEVPLGAGQVDWDAYLPKLHEVGFDGFLTIERECREDAAADIAEAVTFLKRRLAELGL